VGFTLMGSLTLLPGTATAQEGLQTAKDLYASAAYEDALAVLSRLQRPDAPAEVQQYRAFCLIALGRLGEAEKAIESVVVANPRYQPTAMDVSPRIQEAFERTRKQLLPDIARQLYVEAKQALDRKDRNASISGFQSVVELIDAASPEVRESLDELRFLAAGFRDLSSALREPQAEKETAEANARAESATRPPEPLAITPPVAIRQVMPPWVPSDTVSRQTVFTGAVRVSISANGLVQAVEIVRPSHPTYDRLLLEAAKAWEYQPARRGGVPIPSEQVVEVQLKPRQ
jgi:TonB family protein